MLSIFYNFHFFSIFWQSDKIENLAAVCIEIVPRFAELEANNVLLLETGQHFHWPILLKIGHLTTISTIVVQNGMTKFLQPGHFMPRLFALNSQNFGHKCPSNNIRKIFFTWSTRKTGLFTSYTIKTFGTRSITTRTSVSLLANTATWKKEQNL